MARAVSAMMAMMRVSSVRFMIVLCVLGGCLWANIGIFWEVGGVARGFCGVFGLFNLGGGVVVDGMVSKVGIIGSLGVVGGA